MSLLQAFLNDNIDFKAQEKIAISDRFKDKEGKLLEFTIKSLSDSDMDEITKKCTKFGKKGKASVDGQRMHRLMVIEGCIDPCLKDSESLKKAGIIDPEQYVSRVLLPGEIVTIAENIMRISGFQDMEELRDEAKNS